MDRQLTLSFTSYPARIRFVPDVLSCLLKQTRPADRIVLYLSEDQFPGKEAALPEALQNAQKEKQLQTAEQKWKACEAKLLARIAELENSHKSAGGMSQETLAEVEGKIKLL